MRTPRALLLGCPLALALALVGCTKADASSDPETSSSAAGDGAASDEELDDQTVGASASVGKELPEELVAELRLQGDDRDGRLVTLAPGFIATAACSDCGAPSYLWFLAVRCADARHCEVLTQECEGKISRDADTTYVLDFQAVEGGPEQGAEVCAGYSGTFEAP